MDLLPSPRTGARLLRLGFLVATAALAAAGVRFSYHRPVVAAGLLGAACAFVLSRWLSRRKLERVLRSGDALSVIERWSASFDRIPNPETMAPLMTATAFAANGWVAQARAAMANAERGPAWEAAIEHRLFLDALLLTFEGDRDAALEQAEKLERLPIRGEGTRLGKRVRQLRGAVGALARAFAHRTKQGDRQRLEDASRSSPLVFWAMRYAAAVIAIDEGRKDEAMSLLATAPAWPAESTFRAFHDEIVAQLAA